MHLRILAQPTAPCAGYVESMPEDPTTDEPITTRALSVRLGVPMQRVIVAVMRLGVMKTATQPLTAEEVEYVEKLLRDTPEEFAGGESGGRKPRRRGLKNPPRRPGGGAPVREPRRPRPSAPSTEDEPPPEA